MPYSTIKVRHLTVLEQACVCASVCCLIWAFRKPTRISLGATAFAVCTVPIGVAISSWCGVGTAEMRVTFLNVGKADAALVEPRGSKGLLIDGGLRTEFFDSGPSIILPFLWWSGCRTLDGIIVSHPQMDHMGGVLSIIPQVRPARLWWNPVEPCPRYLTRIFAEAWKADTQVFPADRNRPPVRMGAATIRFLNRPSLPGSAADPHALNDACLVCRVECGRVAFLFTGDLEAPGEEELVSAGVPLTADVLKVGHHGSLTSTSRKLVEAVRPKVAIISCEHPLTRGSPALEVLERLRSTGARVFVTGKDGAVTVETNGRTIQVKTGRENPLDESSARKSP